MKKYYEVVKGDKVKKFSSWEDARDYRITLGLGAVVNYFDGFNKILNINEEQDV